MKAVPKVNTDGLYLEDVIVDDAFNGVVPFYSEVKPSPVEPDATEQEGANRDGQQPAVVPEPVIVGYVVGIPVSPGLYHPRFDLPAWNNYQAALDRADIAYQTAFEEWSRQPEEGREEAPQYVSPEQPKLWTEGLTPEEIEEITKNQPQEPTDLEVLKERLAEAEARNVQLVEENTMNQLALMELHKMILDLQGGAQTV